MTQLPPHDLSALALALRSARARGRGRTSGVFQWMQRNESSLASLIAACGADWRLIAAEIAAAGVRNGDGAVPTAEGCRKTWQRVRLRIAGQAGTAEVAARAVVPAAKARAGVRFSTDYQAEAEAEADAEYERITKIARGETAKAAGRRDPLAPPVHKPRFAEEDRSPEAEAWRRVRAEADREHERRMRILMGTGTKAEAKAPAPAKAPAAGPARTAEAARATIRETVKARMTKEEIRTVAEALATVEALENGRPVPAWIGKRQLTLDELTAADMAEFAAERMRAEAAKAEEDKARAEAEAAGAEAKADPLEMGRAAVSLLRNAQAAGSARRVAAKPAPAEQAEAEADKAAERTAKAQAAVALWRKTQAAGPTAKRTKRGALADV